MTNELDIQQFEKLKFAREQLEKERAHRREKLWKIFSWAGTLLVAITGGIVALKTNPPNGFEFSWWLRGTIIASVIFLMAYSSLWIKQNLAIEGEVQKALDECDIKLGIDSVLPKNKQKFGYIAALFMLAAAAIVAIVVNV